ncbi:MAG: 30S ribosomal protein S7 [Patescibacteria group bacterium]|nr:30S ribosomal protein S7 [Patescibacteria group bacterium]
MRRKIKIKHRLMPDATYQSLKVSKLINYLMEKGHKNIARDIVYGAFEDIKTKTKRDPLEVFEDAINNIGPLMETKSRRVGGANYQIPHEVSPERRLALTLRWLVAFARAKKGKPIRGCLVDEILAAAKNEGEAVKRRENVHKMAESNRAFAHFARRHKTSRLVLTPAAARSSIR